MGKRIITTENLEEDLKIEGELRPQYLTDYIGQEKAKQTLSVYIEAAKARGEALDHVLFYGPPGLGKTTLAGIIANEMGVHMKVTSGPAIEKPGEMAAILNSLQEHDVLFVDEIHRLNRQVEEVLYPAMEDYAIDIMIGKGAGARSIRLNLPKFTLVGATTRAGMLTAPLRDRFGVVNRLEFYTDEELKTIILRSASVLNVEIEEEGALELARRSRGTPRLANRLLKRVRDFAQVRCNGKITAEVASLALDLLDKGLVTDQIVLTVGYDMDNLKDPERQKQYRGEITTDMYGRKIPKHAHGTMNLDGYTSSSGQILQGVTELFDRIVDKNLLVRRINMSAEHVIPESQAQEKTEFHQLDLFTDYAAVQKEQEKEAAKLERERKMQKAVLEIKKKFGKNAVLRGMNLEEGATARDRNGQIGGHKA